MKIIFRIQLALPVGLGGITPVPSMALKPLKTGGRMPNRLGQYRSRDFW